MPGWVRALLLVGAGIWVALWFSIGPMLGSQMLAAGGFIGSSFVILLIAAWADHVRFVRELRAQS